MKSVTSCIVVALLFLSLFAFTSSIHPAEAELGTIYIRADGSISPSTANITTFDNVTYAFTSNVTAQLVVRRSNIVVDGAGHSLSGEGYNAPQETKGVYVLGVSNVTIKNMEIQAVEFGVFISQSNYCKVYENVVKSNWWGVYVEVSIGNRIFNNVIKENVDLGVYLSHGAGHIVSGNTIESNDVGIFVHQITGVILTGNTIRNNHRIGIECDWPTNTFYHNNIINNTDQVRLEIYIIQKPIPHCTWDNGYLEGNYWSDYRERYPNATELGDSGIWNTSYTMIVWNYTEATKYMNEDKYPLMSPYIAGDYNHDGVVNMTDANMVKNAWQSKTGDLNYNPHADLNMDGIIDIKDASIIGLNWQKHA